MPKTKLAVVSLLSLLIVVAPVSAVLAKTGPVNRPLNRVGSKEQIEEESKPLTSVFQRIEDQGGREVSDVKLDEEKGEGWFGAVVGGIIGAVAGVGWYSITHAFCWNGREAGMAAAEGAMKGAVVTGIATSIL